MGKYFLTNDNIKYNVFLRRLVELREERGLTQQNIVDALPYIDSSDPEKKTRYLTLRTYGDYERGKHEMPLWLIYGLANFYGVSIDYLTGRDDVRTIHTSEISKLTGLSPEAVLALQQNNDFRNYNSSRSPFTETITGTISRLCIDHEAHRDSSVINAIRAFIDLLPDDKTPIRQNIKVKDSNGTTRDIQISKDRRLPENYSVNTVLIVMEYLKDALLRMNRH